MEKRRALGRGLDALIPDAPEPITDLDTQSQELVSMIEVSDVVPNKYQPRENFDQEKLSDLASSIQEKGVVQPILVRKNEKGYELIAGERRLRALKLLGIKEAPAIIRHVDDLEAMELALIENLQREGLNPIEEAHSYKRLVDEFGFTQEKIAQAIGKDRSSIANILRLLNLPLEIQRYVSKGFLSMGHARAILGVSGLQQQLNLCKKIIDKGLSVRETEKSINPAPKRRSRPAGQQELNIAEQEERLQSALGTKVRIKHGKKRGSIIISYYSLKDYSRVAQKLITK